MGRFGIALILALCGFVLIVAYVLEKPEKPVALTLSPAGFADLPGWSSGPDAGSLEAMRRSCRVIVKRRADRPLHASGIGGLAADWGPFCRTIAQDGLSVDQFKSAVETHLRPFSVAAKGEVTGKFTGYYEPLLNGSFERSGAYTVPLYARPSDLVTVDLGRFRSSLKGERIAGRLNNTWLEPYPDRSEISSKGLTKAQPLLYVDSELDAFFLHIQGSGRVRLPDGSLQGVGYAAQNGHSYVAIGRVLVAEGALTREEVSLQSIKAWLKANPDRAVEILNQNPSFVFFRLIDAADGPFGSGGVPLVARRALAVDRRHLPLHVPLWLSTTHPDPSNREGAPISFDQLMVAQDTGGAIRGEIRGDVFWGFGPEAEEIAGRMANAGRYWLLLPKAAQPLSSPT